MPREMKPRQYLVDARNSVGLSLRQAAAYLEISSLLLSWLEMDDIGVTHPNIADRITEMYGLDLEERNSMVAAQHRLVPGVPQRHKRPKAGMCAISNRIIAARKRKEPENRKEEENRHEDERHQGRV